MTAGIATPFAKWIRTSGRSWWVAQYRDGTTLAEWETIPLVKRLILPLNPKQGARSRWEEARKDGMIGLRLFCPDGRVGGLEAKRDHLLFQLKVAKENVGTGGAPSGHEILAHVIGVCDDDGSCQCFAWEFPGRLVQFRDNVHRFAYYGFGPLSLEVQDIRIGATPAAV